jgi:hypothetical protein
MQTTLFFLEFVTRFGASILRDESEEQKRNSVVRVFLSCLRPFIPDDHGRSHPV